MKSNTYKEVSIDEIKSRWLHKEWKQEDKFNMYIHNPFCPSICHFCIHSGSVTTINSDPYKKYYYEYLPNLINEFSEVIKSRPVDTIYFGGGTASLMTEEVMRLVFESIPNFKDIPNKVFEGHPVSINKKKIDILAEYNFSYMTFGVQTFNEEILKQQNRIPAKVEVFKENIRYAKEKGIIVSCDLLAFIAEHSAEAVKQVEEDLYFLSKEIQPNVITIYPKIQALKSEILMKTDGQTSLKSFEMNKSHDKTYELILNLRKVLKKFIRLNKEFRPIWNTLSLDREEIMKSYEFNYFLTTLTEEKFIDIHQYNSTSFGKHKPYQNVLALGGYGAVKPPYSYHNKSFCYIHKCEDWTPKFYVTYDEDLNKDSGENQYVDTKH